MNCLFSAVNIFSYHIIQIVISFRHKKDAISCIHDGALVKLWRFIFAQSTLMCTKQVDVHKTL